MAFPKKIMSTSELVAQGFKKDFLIQMAHRRNQKYAYRTPGGKKFYFDTEKLQQALDKMTV